MSEQNYQLPPSVPPAGAYPRADSTDTIAMIIEIVFGLFGIMGMGWIYVGNLLVGGLLFVGWWVVILIVALSPTILTALTIGLGAPAYCCLACMLPLNITVALVSGIRAKDYVRNTNAKGSVLYLILAAVVGSILICLAITIPLFALGGLAVIGGSQIQP